MKDFEDIKVQKVIPWFLFLTVWFWIGMANAQGQPSATRFVWNGSGVAAGWQDQYGTHEVGVAEGSNKNTRTAYLTLFESVADPASEVCVTETVPFPHTRCDFTRYTWTYGWGNIPPEHVQIAVSAARLNTDISKIPDFYFSRCTVDTSTGVADCIDLPPVGTFALEWKRTGDGSDFFSGVSEYRRGKYVFRSSGTSRTFSGTATGSFLGTPVSDIPGGTGSGVNVTMEIFPAP